MVRQMSELLGVSPWPPPRRIILGRLVHFSNPCDPELDAFLANVTLESFTPYTVAGKAELRAILEKVRRNGYSVVDQELEIDLRAIAIPIQNASGRVIAAMNVSAQASNTRKKQLVERFLPALRDAAMKMRPLLIG